MYTAIFSMSVPALHRLEQIWRKIDKFGIFVGDKEHIVFMKEYLSKQEQPNDIYEVNNDDQLAKIDLNILKNPCTIFVLSTEFITSSLWKMIDQIGKRGRYQPPHSDKDIKTNDDLKIGVFLTTDSYEKTRSLYRRDPRHFAIYQIHEE